MPVLSEFTFASSDGKHQVYARRWTPDGEVKAVLQIAHGVAEHILRYDDFARYMGANGFLVVGNDHLGHGRTAASKEDLGWFSAENGWDFVVDDMKRLRDRTAAENPDKPYYLFGHSMGSFLARTYLIKYPGTLDGCIISGTGQMSGIITSAGRTAAKWEIRRHGERYQSLLLNNMAFGSYNNAFQPARTPHDWLSRDTEVVDRYEADPLCGFIPTAELLRDMMGGLKLIASPKNLKKMDLAMPVLFMSGAMDPVGANGKGVEAAFRSFRETGVLDVSMKLYPEGRHEMLNELNRAEVYADILAWLEKRTAGES